jgi:DNA-binding NarL/FixJ family response regulator
MRACMERCHILLASNFALLRAGLAALLARCANVEVVAESTVGPEMVDRVRDIRPDILILEATPDGSDTFGLIGTLHDVAPATRIIALSATTDRDFALRLLSAGVHGYLSNRGFADELGRAVTTVAQGQVFLCPSASSLLLAEYRRQEAWDPI